jgi:hypothetical protein
MGNHEETAEGEMTPLIKGLRDAWEKDGKRNFIAS